MKKIFSFIFSLTLIFSCKKDPEPVLERQPFLHYYGTSGDETARQIKVAANGDIIVCGYGAGPNGGTDFFLLRTDADGNQRWLNYFGGAGDEVTWSFDKAADGGFIIGGYTNSFGAGGNDFYIVKTDANGNMLWTKTYGGVYNDDAISIISTGTGCLIAGISNSGNDDNAWILRLNENGDSLWSHNYGGIGADGAMSVCANANGTYAITGYTYSTFTNSADGFLMLLNDSGRQTGFYNYATPDYDEPHAVVPAIDGNGWIVSGHQGSVSPLSTHNVFIRAIASDGSELWNKIYGGVAHDGSEDMCVSGNRYGIVARSNSRPDFGEDIYLLLVNPDGSVHKESWLGTTSDDAGYGIAADRGTIIVGGYSRGGSFGGKDIYLERLGL